MRQDKKTQACANPHWQRAETRAVVKRTSILSPRAAALERIKDLVVDTLPSAKSKRAYHQAPDDFFRWCEAEASSGFTKATVNAYRESRGPKRYGFASRKPQRVPPEIGTHSFRR